MHKQIKVTCPFCARSRFVGKNFGHRPSPIDGNYYSVCPFCKSKGYISKAASTRLVGPLPPADDAVGPFHQS